MQPSDLQKIIEDLFDYLHLPGLKLYAFYFAIGVYLLGLLLIFLATKQFKKVVKRREQRSVEEDLFPAFDENDVDEYTRIFINTRYQFSSPTRDGSSNLDGDTRPFLFPFIGNRRKNLIQFLVTKALRRPRKLPTSLFNRFARIFDLILADVSPLQQTELIDKRFIMVLADTGMGKTAFMVNLYFQYIRNTKRDFNVALLPFTMEGFDQKLDEITNKKNVILLLDGLDEDPKAIEDSESRKRELLSKVRDFRKVIITCRSQFFIDERLEWESTGVLQQHSKKDQTFGKVFISVFDDKDINQYLMRQYGRDSHKYKRAEEVIARIPDLSMRPLILKYVDDLIGYQSVADQLFQLYQVFVDKWIDREKFNVKPEFHQQFHLDMLNFSKAVALHIFDKNDGELFLKPEEIETVAAIHNIPIKSLELRSKSLLNRGEQDHYKFAHKSFYEFFLSEHLLHNPQIPIDFNATANDAAFSFYRQKCLVFHTIPLLERIVQMKTPDIKPHDRDNLSNRLLQQLECGYGFNITWRNGHDGQQVINWQSLTDWASHLTISNADYLIDQKAFIPFIYLKTIKFVNCHVSNMEFLVFLNVREIILDGAQIDLEKFEAVNAIRVRNNQERIKRSYY